MHSPQMARSHRWQVIPVERSGCRKQGLKRTSSLGGGPPPGPGEAANSSQVKSVSWFSGPATAM